MAGLRAKAPSATQINQNSRQGLADGGSVWSRYDPRRTQSDYVVPTVAGVAPTVQDTVPVHVEAVTADAKQGGYRNADGSWSAEAPPKVPDRVATDYRKRLGFADGGSLLPEQETWVEKRDRETAALQPQPIAETPLDVTPVPRRPTPLTSAGLPTFEGLGVPQSAGLLAKTAAQRTPLTSAGLPTFSGLGVPQVQKGFADGGRVRARGLRQGIPPVVEGLIPGAVNPTVADDINITTPSGVNIDAKKGEYVLSIEDVAALGGSGAVDSMVKALRKQNGIPLETGAKSPGQPDNMGRMNAPGLADGGWTAPYDWSKNYAARQAASREVVGPVGAAVSSPVNSIASGMESLAGFAGNVVDAMRQPTDPMAMVKGRTQDVANQLGGAAANISQPMAAAAQVLTGQPVVGNPRAAYQDVPASVATPAPVQPPTGGVDKHTPVEASLRFANMGLTPNDLSRMSDGSIPIPRKPAPPTPVPTGAGSYMVVGGRNYNASGLGGLGFGRNEDQRAKDLAATNVNEAAYAQNVATAQQGLDAMDLQKRMDVASAVASQVPSEWDRSFVGTADVSNPSFRNAMNAQGVTKDRATAAQGQLATLKDLVGVQEKRRSDALGLKQQEMATAGVLAKAKVDNDQRVAAAILHGESAEKVAQIRADAQNELTALKLSLLYKEPKETEMDKELAKAQVAKAVTDSTIAGSSIATALKAQNLELSPTKALDRSAINPMRWLGVPNHPAGFVEPSSGNIQTPQQVGTVQKVGKFNVIKK
jgi:hypothetical protein